MDTIWHIVALIWIGLAFLTFISLYFMKIKAPFGRHTRTDWGPMINNTLGWIVMELPSLICLWAGYLYFRSETTPEMAIIPMLLWTAHYFNRAFIYPFRLKNKKQNILKTF